MSDYSFEYEILIPKSRVKKIIKIKLEMHVLPWNKRQIFYEMKYGLVNVCMWCYIKQAFKSPRLDKTSFQITRTCDKLLFCVMFDNVSVVEKSF